VGKNVLSFSSSRRRSARGACQSSKFVAAIAALSVVGCFGIASARAGYTTVNPPPPGEKSTNEILDHIYGGTFLQAGVDYTNGVVVAHRIFDTAAAAGRGTRPFNLLEDGDQSTAPLNTTGTDPTDQLWTADSVSCTAAARYALYNQNFGFFDGTSGGNYSPLFNLGGTGFNVSGSASIGNLGGHIWRWSRNGDNATLTSKNADNAAGIDHMVTYQINFISNTGGSAPGSADVKTYLLFWEDKLPNDNPDYDYNDLVVEIRAQSTSIPEPASALGAASLALLAGLRRRRGR